MLFKNGFNVISVQIQRILMWRFWTCERSELRVRTLCNSTALAHIPLSLHYTRKCSLASTVVYLSCFQWLTHGWWSTDRCQQFLKFLKQFGRAHVSKWFLLFFSDFPVFQFVTFNCSYDIDYMPKNIEIKKFKGFKHLPMYQVCCLPLVYCFKYNQFVKKTFMLRSTRNPFLHPLSGGTSPQASTPCHVEDGAPICLVTGSWSG